MGKKKSDATTKAKPSGKISVSAMLANMDNKKERPSSSKAPKKPPLYTDGIHYPSSDEEESQDEGIEEHRERRKTKISEQRYLDISMTSKNQKKLETKQREAREAAERAKKDALKDDKDAFIVHAGTKTLVLEADANANVEDVTIDSFSVSVRGKELLTDTCVKISHGKRYGLVGPNGTGKSTLLKLLAWRKIPVPKNMSLLLVEQEAVADDKNAVEAVVSANEKLVALREEAEVLKNGPDDSGERLTQVFDSLKILESDTAEPKASKILAGLGFTEEMKTKPTKSLSGGWRMRISLAKALFMEPTLLLLDEPTNHLDLRAVLWLGEHLCHRKTTTLVVVSHDRDFLNSVCTGIIHLHDKKLHYYNGNYDSFEDGYIQQRNGMNTMCDKFKKQETDAKKSGNRGQQEKVAKSKGKGSVKEWIDYSVEFHFPEPTTKLTPPLLQLVDVSFSYSYSDKEDFKLSVVNEGIDMGTRVAIVGPNGGGKSTLLNLLAGVLQPTEGEVRRSQKLRIGRYSQHFVDTLTPEETPVGYLLRLYPNQEGCSKQEAVRRELGKFGLASDNHLTPIVNLSGGQKARVVFTSISMSKPHILLLDEPTNNLDMESIDALGDALDEFTGGIVLVSHDARLVSRVCEDEKSQIWVVEEGKVTVSDLSFEEYKDGLLKEIKEEVDKCSCQTNTCTTHSKKF